MAIIKAKSPVLKLVIIGAFLSGMGIGLLGAGLIYLGSKGNTEFTFFGQTFKSENVGIAAIFLGAVVIVLLVRRALKSLDSFPKKSI